MARELWRLLARWFDLDIPSVASIVEWFSWVDACKVTNMARYILEGVAATLMWSIWNFCLLDLPMGGRIFTWMNKNGTKLSKIDRFLISEDVLESHSDILVTILDKLWRRDITDSLRTIENLINAGNATDEDREQRIRKFHDLDNLEKLDSLDLLQKDRIKWDVEGDENSKFFHSIINARRKYQSIQESMVSLEEIRSAVWDCVFFDSNELPQGTNSAFITLIPKFPNPLFVKDYRPISLIGFQYKIIAKILANRLSKVINSIISQEQSAFISGRQILDGPLILSEIIDWYKIRNKKLLLFKVDFEKDFDSVSWRYLDHIMCMLGFGVKWRKWIKSCLYSARTSILINASLHIALKDAMAANLLNGVKLGPSNFCLSHLFYADNVIIVSEWDHRDMENIIRVLHVFYMASGLKVNINKSNLFRVGVSLDEVANMATNSGCLSGSFPLTYLGFPIGSNMNRVVNWKVLIDRFKLKLSGWKANLLSIGGRLTLIKSGPTEDNKKIAWVKWLNILASFDKGGLRVESLKAFNVSLLYKWRWRLLKNPVALWVKVINSIHGVEAGMTPYACQTNGLWAKIVGTINHLHSSSIVPYCSIKYKVGDGSLIRFWIDTSAGDLPLLDRFNRLFHLEKSKDCMIQVHISNGSCSWDWIRPILSGRSFSDFVHMLDVIGSMEVSQDSDSCFWYLSNDENFSVSSIRHHIDDHLLPSMASSTRWCKFIPRKVNIFM
ncbi:putative RNA-directed DNA polymerase, eukaryota, reverse transcriptase zinc-binding domain protein [Tanacetum coccineum]